MTAKNPNARPYTRRSDLTADKVCLDCKQTKPVSEFSIARSRPGGIDPYCKDCKRIRNRRYQTGRKRNYSYIARGRAKDPVRYKINELLNRCKVRALARSIPFDLDLEHLISITKTHCPVLGIKFDFDGRKRANGEAPSLDRFRPELGYVRGNVNVISWRANRMKLDATPAELRALADWATALEGASQLKVAA